jgi:hypothetical protein
MFKFPKKKLIEILRFSFEFGSWGCPVWSLDRATFKVVLLRAVEAKAASKHVSELSSSSRYTYITNWQVHATKSHRNCRRGVAISSLVGQASAYRDTVLYRDGMSRLLMALGDDHAARYLYDVYH